MDEKSLIQRKILFLPGLIGLGHVLFQQTRGISYLIVIEYLVFGTICCSMYGLDSKYNWIRGSGPICWLKSKLADNHQCCLLWGYVL